MPVFPKIKGYSLKKKLGEGGMASVYLGVQKKLDRLVAIKVFIPNLFGDQNHRKRFLKEGRTLSKLNHPNIVNVYDVGFHDQYYYIVMEYLVGNLKERIRKEGRIPPHKAFHIVVQIADALFSIHKLGMIHRDIKPENIMFRKDQTPVLLDFGIAKTIGSNTNLTRSGVLIGTPIYMSPEQCDAKHIDGRSDVYSLGVVLYEMLSGKIPYNSKDTRSIVIKHLKDPVPLLPKSIKKYQPIINRMMTKKKSNRLKSYSELTNVIKALLFSETLNKTKEFRPKAKIKSPKNNQRQRYAKTQTTVSYKKQAEKPSSSAKKKKKKTGRKKFTFKKMMIYFFIFCFVSFLFANFVLNYSFTEIIKWIFSLFDSLFLKIYSLF